MAHKKDKLLSIGMSEAERYELLKDKTISVPSVDVEKLAQIDINDYDALEKIGKSDAFKILRKIGEDFGIDETVSSLYVAINLHEIKRSRIVGYTQNAESIKSYPLPASIAVGLADIISNVNTSDKNLIKYIPDDFLSDLQKEAKQIASKETVEYIEKKNRQRAAKAGKAHHVDWFVGEAYVDYHIDKDSIVFIFRKKMAAAR